MAWIATNKKNGATQHMTDAEKSYWESSVYGNRWTFDYIQPIPRAKAPEAVKAAIPKKEDSKPPTVKKKRKAKSTKKEQP